MRVMKLDVMAIEVPEVRVTSSWDNEMLEMFRESLRQQGMIEPIVVAQEGDRYQLVDGLHRLDEAKAKRQKEIDAVVYEGGLKEVYLMNLTLNRLRGKTPTSQMVKVCSELYEKHGVSMEEIAQRTGMKMDYVEKMVTIGQAHYEVWKALDEERIGVGAAYLISRIPDEDAQVKVLFQQFTYNMPLKDLEAHIKGVMTIMANNAQARQQRKVVQPPPIPCDVCAELYPVKEMRSKVLCPSCIGVLAESYAQARRELAAEAAEKASQGTPAPAPSVPQEEISSEQGELEQTTPPTSPTAAQGGP